MRSVWLLPAVGVLLFASVLAQSRGARPAAEALPVASSEPLPANLGIGRPASPEEIARLDIDVSPDGDGLPPGGANAAAGDAVYAARCASCHGAAGTGGPGGAVVGRTPNDRWDFGVSVAAEGTKTVGNFWPYATTLFDYIRRAMPYDRPGSLTDQEVYALTAWILWRNDIIGRDAVMDALTLPAVVMPARDRFVPDDRGASTTVR